jgi:adenosylmethionine-8-amino-7-oxononanoate aminotransferase
VLGATGVIEVHDPRVLCGVQEFALGRGVWLRPFGRYLYAMPPYVISDDELLRVIDVMRAWFDEAT